MLMSWRSGASLSSSSIVRTPAMPLPTMTSLVFFIVVASGCGRRAGAGHGPGACATAVCRPGARPAGLESTQCRERRQRHHREGDEAPEIGSGELLALAHGIGQEAATEGP